jgi:hypothetical protein
MVKLISILLVLLSVTVFCITERKVDYVANGFGALFGVGLGVCVDRWLEEERRKRNLTAFLRACMQLTNSNIGKIDDVINRYGTPNNSEGKIRGAFVDLLSGIPHESYASFIETGLQADLEHRFQNKFLYCRACIVDLHGYVAGRNALPSSSFQLGKNIEVEWKALQERLDSVKGQLKELAELIRSYLSKAKEKNFE